MVHNKTERVNDSSKKLEGGELYPRASKSIPSDTFFTNLEIALPVVDRIGLLSSITGRIKQKRDFKRVMIHGKERLEKIGEWVNP